MRIANRLFILSLLTAPLLAMAQPPEDLSSTGSDGPKGPEAWNKVSHKVVRRAQYSEYTLGMATWQEDIMATRGTESSPMRTQSLGVNLGYNWNRFMVASNWRQWHTFDLTIGALKGKGSSSGIPDELKKQNFYMAEFAPGLMWRTTPVSEIGFALPLVYRIIKWDLISTSGLKMDKSSGFSAGGSLTYVARFTGKNSIHVTVTHQHMWDAVMWSFGFNRVF